MPDLPLKWALAPTRKTRVLVPPALEPIQYFQFYSFILLLNFEWKRRNRDVVTDWIMAMHHDSNLRGGEPFVGHEYRYRRRDHNHSLF